jgi:hypothetical protein
MLMFCGSDLELAVDRVVVRRDSPALCCAHDAYGQGWIIVQVDEDRRHLSWCCAPVTAQSIEAVETDPRLAWDALRHGVTGKVEIVTVDDGKCVPDRRVPSVWLSTNSRPVFGTAEIAPALTA